MRPDILALISSGPMFPCCMSTRARRTTRITLAAAVDKYVIALTTLSTACERRRWPVIFGEQRLRLHSGATLAWVSFSILIKSTDAALSHIANGIRRPTCLRSVLCRTRCDERDFSKRPHKLNIRVRSSFGTSNLW